MTSQVDIANRALLSVGARAQISSLSPSDGSDEANAISVLWTPTFESLARSAHWNCLRKQVVLSLLAAAQGTPENPDGTLYPIPDTPWLYAYAYPSDCLDMRYIIPSYPANTGSTTPSTTINNAAGTWLPSGGQIPYQVSYAADANGSPITIILTNQDQAQAAYTVNQPNPATWDSLFQAAMVASLGAFLVPALSLSLPLMQLSIKTAEMAIAQARAADGNEGVTSMDHLPDWMQARAGGAGWGPGFGLGVNNWSGYCWNMTWPYGSNGTYGD
jgi:hypothetical protein